VGVSGVAWRGLPVPERDVNLDGPQAGTSRGTGRRLSPRPLRREGQEISSPRSGGAGGCLYHTRGSLGPEDMRLALYVHEGQRLATPGIPTRSLPPASSRRSVLVPLNFQQVVRPAIQLLPRSPVGNGNLGSYGTAFSPDGTRAYVTNEHSGVAVIDVASNLGAAPLRVLSERSDDDHAFFFKPASTASAVIGICRTRTPTAL
jgi:YVTN family beta-propeller protein